MKTIPARNPEVVWRDEPAARDAIYEALERGDDVADQGWVLLVDRGTMHQLNLIGGEIWCLTDGTRDAAAIAALLAERYDAPAGEILSDVEAFLTECAGKGWLRLEER
jgi:pyrroloquinoline quinone biosynthesis protein D